RGTRTPEPTPDAAGFVHPHDVRATVERTEVHFIVRDFVTAELKVKEELLTRLAEETVRDWPGSSVRTKVVEQYRNMREVLDRNPCVSEFAREAIRRTGRTPIEGRIRGGTDGSILSERGLPTPNLSSGQHAIHSRHEWASVQEMEVAVEVVLNLCARWADERA
ncbi:MAG: M20/M25/M40 family metallo-hydrolase, partial [bacterium]